MALFIQGKMTIIHKGFYWLWIKMSHRYESTIRSTFVFFVLLCELTYTSSLVNRKCIHCSTVLDLVENVSVVCPTVTFLLM